MELRPTGFRSDLEPENATIIREVQPYTMTTPDRVYALIQAVKYIAENDIKAAWSSVAPGGAQHDGRRARPPALPQARHRSLPLRHLRGHAVPGQQRCRLPGQ